MVAREDYWNTVCPVPEVVDNTTINFTFFDYDSATTNLTLYYECPVSFPYQPHAERIDERTGLVNLPKPENCLLFIE
jgi:hypothetical protein